MPRQPSGGVARGTASPCCVDARHSFAVGLELEARAGHVPTYEYPEELRFAYPLLDTKYYDVRPNGFETERSRERAAARSRAPFTSRAGRQT